MSEQQPFTWPIRVYWEDTDGGGVVYHSQYVNFFERARTEWLRSLGLHQAELQRDHNLVFAIHRMQIDFLRPARLDDELQVTVVLVDVGAASMQFRQVITIQNKSDEETPKSELMSTADVYAASLSAREFKLVRIPDNISIKLKRTINS